MLSGVRRKATNAANAAAAVAAMAAFVPMPPKVNTIFDSTATQTDPSTSTISYMPGVDKFSRAHEVGHLLDAEVLTPGDRNYFQRLMKAPAGAWNTGTGSATGGNQSPSEWFADYFATTATGGLRKGHTDSSYAAIGPIRAQRFAAAIARLGKRHNLQAYKDPAGT